MPTPITRICACLLIGAALSSDTVQAAPAKMERTELSLSWKNLPTKPEEKVKMQATHTLKRTGPSGKEEAVADVTLTYYRTHKDVVNMDIVMEHAAGKAYCTASSMRSYLFLYCGGVGKGQPRAWFVQVEKEWTKQPIVEFVHNPQAEITPLR